MDSTPLMSMITKIAQFPFESDICVFFVFGSSCFTLKLKRKTMNKKMENRRNNIKKPILNKKPERKAVIEKPIEPINLEGLKASPFFIKELTTFPSMRGITTARKKPLMEMKINLPLNSGIKYIPQILITGIKVTKVITLLRPNRVFILNQNGLATNDITRPTLT